MKKNARWLSWWSALLALALLAACGTSTSVVGGLPTSTPVPAIVGVPASAPTAVPASLPSAAPAGVPVVPTSVPVTSPAAGTDAPASPVPSSAEPAASSPAGSAPAGGAPASVAPPAPSTPPAAGASAPPASAEPSSSPGTIRIPGPVASPAPSAAPTAIKIPGRPDPSPSPSPSPIKIPGRPDPSPSPSPSPSPKPVQLAAAPATVNFGVVKLGSISGQQTVTLTNTSTQTFKASGVTFTVSDPAFQVVSTSCSAPDVAPGGTCTLALRFLPTGNDARAYGGALVVATSIGPSNAVVLNGVATK